MSGRAFRSFPSTPVKAEFGEARIVGIARQLLDEHVAAREAATLAINQVCGNCKGSGRTEATIIVSSEGPFTVPCYACEGTGKPNDKVQACPDMTPQDNERIWKIGQLLKGKHRVAILALIKERYPEMYSSPVDEGAPN